jgi:hypothetical protein
VALAFLLSGCTSQFALGPAALSAPPVIPGFTPVPLPGGGFIEEPNTPPTPPATNTETVLGALSEAQQIRTLVRQLAR